LHQELKVLDADEDTWTALSEQLGEALLDAERTFLDVVERRGMNRLMRDEAARTYLIAWSRLALVHRAMARYLLD
jgi:hypothetical protein